MFLYFIVVRLRWYFLNRFWSQNGGELSENPLGGSQDHEVNSELEDKSSKAFVQTKSSFGGNDRSVAVNGSTVSCQ